MLDYRLGGPLAVADLSTPVKFPERLSGVEALDLHTLLLFFFIF